MKQVGDYVIETDGQAIPTWLVRMAGAEEYLSNHDTEREAMAAVKRYQAGDRRRQRGKAREVSPEVRRRILSMF